MKGDSNMCVACGSEDFTWVENWARIPQTESTRRGWAHHGIVETQSGRIVTFHPADRTVLVLDEHGNLIGSWRTDLIEGHGMTLARDKGGERLWMSDTGRKRLPELNYEYPKDADLRHGQVVKMDLNGRVLMKLPTPTYEGYEKVHYAPTGTAIDDEGLGGSGDIWVADGYGLNLLHRFDKNGKQTKMLDGSTGAGRFDTPHAVFIDRRKAHPELYVADRTNKRVQVFDLEGNFKRAFGSDFLTSPSGFAAHGDKLYIAELNARVVALDINDKFVGSVGDNEAACDVDGWPNKKLADGKIVRAEGLTPGKFNSPHGITTDKQGNIYVAEWLIGGRIVKLVRS